MNGWKRACVLTLGNMAAMACVLLPMYFVFIRLSMAITMPAPIGPPLYGAISPPMYGWTIGLVFGWTIFVSVAAAIIAVPLTRWYWNPVIVSAVLHEGHCGSCGYALPEGATASDGCTVCPECGAAWKLPAGDVGGAAEGQRARAMG